MACESVALRDLISVSSEPNAPVTHADAVHLRAIDDMLFLIAERDAQYAAVLAKRDARDALRDAEIAELRAPRLPSCDSGTSRILIRRHRAAAR